MRRLPGLSDHLKPLTAQWTIASRQRDALERLAALHEMLPLLDDLRSFVIQERALAMVETYDALKAHGNGTYKVITDRLGISKALIDQTVRVGRGGEKQPWKRRAVEQT